jgi:hypothetical protein
MAKQVAEKMTDEQVIERAAVMLAGRHENEALAPILKAQMLLVASCQPSSGGAGYVRWIAALQALGEMIVSIAKQEAKMSKHWKL